MKISKERFDEWAQTVWGDHGAFSPSRVAKIAEISKSSFFFQRSREYVEASVILATARGLGLEPLEEITKFEEFSFLSRKIQPDQHEVLSQIGPEHLLEEILNRLQHKEGTHELGVLPEPYGLKRWLDSTGMYGRYEEIAKRLDLSNISALSKKVNENRLDLGQLADVCSFGGLNGRFALVVSGYLTLEEAGYPWDLRELTLREVPGKRLLDELWAARKWLEKEVQVKELERGVFKSFG